jgi:hypothetical protein
MTDEVVEKKKMGTGTKVAIGCGSGCLVFVLLAAIGIGAGVFYVKKMIDTYETELNGYGFVQVTEGQMLNITEPITEPILLKAQSVQLRADCSTNLAVMAQMCEIFGKIDGKLYFRGQMLTIHPGAEITGGVDAQAQILQNNGTIEGEITGKYQHLEQGSVPE